MANPTIGVIGGTGLYELDGLEDIERVELQTPYGAPSDAYVLGTLHGRRMAFLPRHGVGHRILPHELNFRANIWGFKKLGVEQLVSVSAVGSMKEWIHPGELVMIDQFIDRTRVRPSSFFGDGVVAHVAFSHPICETMRKGLLASAERESIKAHDGGTYVCIEGPQFSTLAESRLYRTWDVAVVGMTNMPEARLASEAEICYATIALATDYDCWHEEEESVSVDAVLAVLKSNAEKAKRVISSYVQNLSDSALEAEPCRTATRAGLLTPESAIPPERRRALAPILDPIFAERAGT